MRVSALSPHIVHEVPEDSNGDSRRASSAANDRLRAVDSAAADDAPGDALSEETKAGLRRLSELIRDKSGNRQPKENRKRESFGRPTATSSYEQNDDQDQNGGAGGAPQKSNIVYIGKRERMLRGYIYVRDAEEVSETKGMLLHRAA